MNHSLYSPNLVPNDFLLLHLKDKLHDQDLSFTLGKESFKMK